MLVYSTAFLVDSPSTCADVLNIVGEWLGEKAHVSVSAAQLERPGSRRMNDGSMVETVSCVSAAPRLYSVRYAHRDSEVHGRQWITEVGLREREETGQTECTVLLQTSEISPLVPPLQITTRPKLIPQIVKRCRLASSTFGLKPRELANTDIDIFRAEINDPKRRQPLVLVSPTQSGDYLVDVKWLQEQLITLADVIVVPTHADTFEMADVLGDKYAVWRGAVNVIFPVVMRQETPVVHTKRFLATELAQISTTGRPESRLLSEVTHRTNLPNKWRHISLDFVREEDSRRDLARKRQEALESGKQRDYIKVLEQTHTDDEKRINDLTAELKQWQDLASASDGDASTLRAENENLKAALRSKERADSEHVVSGLDRLAKEALVNCLQGKAVPHSVLSAIKVLFPERIVVLPDAIASSKKSEKFAYADKLLAQLMKLATQYWENLAQGKGDANARRVFGNSYSAKESETVAANNRARKLRTFEYQGQPITMMKHLKIGVKESAAETIRVHFEWLPEQKRIVIGYCGPHPDHK